MNWRLVDSGVVSPARSAAIDEAILLARSKGLVPNTLHLYRRDAPTVSIGHFESVERCVNLPLAREKGVHIIRRMSGGSAIYTDQCQLIYSLVVNEDAVPRAPAEAFATICQGMVVALGLLGLRAEFKPVNDVQVGGKKLSGSAQLRRWGAVVQHGTVIVDMDLDLMASLLKGGKRSRQQMTSLTAEMGRRPSWEEVKGALVEGFSQVFGASFQEEGLINLEVEEADRLVLEKYGRDEHNLQR